MQLNKQTFHKLTKQLPALSRNIVWIFLVNRIQGMVKIALLIIWSGVALYTVISLLYSDVKVFDLMDNQVTLQSRVIDELEVWIEERQNEREKRLVRPGEYFLQ